jgi:hypothetical protein
MAKITLTEALAQHKLTLKKIEDKTRELSHYTVRDERIVDPLAKSGSTSEKFVAEQMQSIEDLSTHAIRLHSSITGKNREVKVRFGNMEMTVEDALTWRREVAPLKKNLLNGILSQARTARQKAGASGSNEAPKVVVSFDEAEAMNKLEALSDALGKLDTELSIVNATQTIEV